MIPNLRYRCHPLSHNNIRPPEPRAPQALRLAAASLYQRTTTTVEPTKEEASIKMD